MGGPRMRFCSRMDVALAVWAAVWALVALLGMVAAVLNERDGLAMFYLLLVLLNGAVIASAVARMDYR